MSLRSWLLVAFILAAALPVAKSQDTFSPSTPSPPLRGPSYGPADSLKGIEDQARKSNSQSPDEQAAALEQEKQKKAEEEKAAKEESARIAKKQIRDKYLGEYKRILEETKKDWQAVVDWDAQFQKSTRQYLEQNDDLPDYLREKYDQLTAERREYVAARYAEVTALQQSKLDYAAAVYKYNLLVATDKSNTEDWSAAKKEKDEFYTKNEASIENLRAARSELPPQGKR